MERRRIVVALGVVVIATLLMGCTLLSEFAGGTPDPAADSAESPTAVPATAESGAPDADVEVGGRWVGSLTFSDFEMLVADEEAALLFANEIAATMDKPYSIMIDAQPAQNTATLTFDGSLRIPGAMSRNGDEVTFEFRQAGTGKLEEGATLPVVFTLTGEVTRGSSPTMSGNVRYDVSTMDGAPGWTQVGTWEVER